MKIRPVVPNDRAEWLRLLLGLHPESAETDHVPSVDAWLSGTSTDELIPSAVFVAERQGGRLGGLLELSVRNYAEGCSGSTPYVESWYVDEDLRGAGVGRALMEAAEEWARANGSMVLASDALLVNRLSHVAHQALGFEVVERIVVFRKRLQR
ncbi:MAG: GNAT family N-acetyltransferase [Rhodothermales bacterium]